MDIFEFENEKYINMTPMQILANDTVEVKCDDSPVSLSCCSENKVNWSTIEWSPEGSVSIPGACAPHAREHKGPAETRGGGGSDGRFLPIFKP